MENKEKAKKELESVGWGLWCILFVVFYGPFFYLSWQISYDDMRGGLLPYVLGFILAAFTAGVITTVANTILQKRIERRHKDERKKTKKKK